MGLAPTFFEAVARQAQAAGVTDIGELYRQQGTAISIKDWVKSGQGVLFLPY